MADVLKKRLVLIIIRYLYIYFEIIRALCKYILVEKKRNNLIRIFNKRFNTKKVSKNVNI